MALPRLKIQMLPSWVCSYDCEHRHHHYWVAWLCNRLRLWWL